MHLRSLLLALLLPALFSASLGPLYPIAVPVPSASREAGAPLLRNPGFECGEGYHPQEGVKGLVPDGWTAKVLTGDPFMSSTQFWGRGNCDPNDMSWEKLEGYDSNIFLAAQAGYGQGFVAPPFDVTLYQSAAVTEGTEYSLSAWMVSLCGGSAMPNTCPPGAYMAKMAGLDPTGGIDPLGQTVQWTEDRRPHIEARWVNLIDATTAQSSTLTVFVRINSPFQHEGNHAFADAVKLVRAPSSEFKAVSRTGNNVAVSWTGDLGPDIPAIPATNHKLSFEIQVKRDAGPWQPWLSEQAAGDAQFSAQGSCFHATYQFRIRAWAVQPEGQPGAWPNHHFVGMWHESPQVQVERAADCTPGAFFPAAIR